MTDMVPVRIPSDTNEVDHLLDGWVSDHPYSATCNCDDCFETWLAMPEPTEAEREARARRFMAIVAPSSKGELVTDWPRFVFPDLLTDEELKAHSKAQRKFVRDGV